MLVLGAPAVANGFLVVGTSRSASTVKGRLDSNSTVHI